MGPDHRNFRARRGRSAARWTAPITIALSVMLVATGCGTTNESQTPGTANPSAGGTTSPSSQAGPQVLRINWPTFPVLDPHILTSGMWLWAMGIGEGLVSQTPDGTNVVPAAADTWQEAADGLTWTFHIRDGLTWSDGTPLTAEDFVASYQRLLDPARGEAGVSLGSNPYRTGLGIAGAADFLNGVSTDWSTVGIRATSPSELVFKLDAPNPVSPARPDPSVHVPSANGQHRRSPD